MFDVWVEWDGRKRLFLSEVSHSLAMRVAHRLIDIFGATACVEPTD